MRFLSDENVRHSAAEALRAQGHDVLEVDDAMPSARDEAVLRRAGDERRILITNDRDFGELVFYRGHAAYGVILLRLKHDTREAVSRRLLQTVELYQDKLAGHFILVTDELTRIRPLDV